MKNRSYKKSKYNIFHGFIFFGKDGSQRIVEAKPKIKVKAK